MQLGARGNFGIAVVHRLRGEERFLLSIRAICRGSLRTDPKSAKRKRRCAKQFLEVTV